MLIEYIKVKKSKDKNNPLLISTKAKLSIKYKIIKLNLCLWLCKFLPFACCSYFDFCICKSKCSIKNTNPVRTSKGRSEKARQAPQRMPVALTCEAQVLPPPWVKKQGKREPHRNRRGSKVSKGSTNHKQGNHRQKLN